MNNPLRKLIEVFRSHPHEETGSFSRQEDQDFCDLPPGFVPIEALYDLNQIPGTSRHVGSQLRIFQTPSDELVTANQRIGIRGGCGHPIYRTERRITPQEVEQGIGGVCGICAAEAAELLKQNLITVPQAEERAIYCTDCASYCQRCLRPNLCIRHTRIFRESATTLIPLCPLCHEKAQKEQFLGQIIQTALSPFMDQSR